MSGIGTRVEGHGDHDRYDRDMRYDRDTRYDRVHTRRGELDHDERMPYRGGRMSRRPYRYRSSGSRRGMGGRRGAAVGARSVRRRARRSDMLRRARWVRSKLQKWERAFEREQGAAA